MLATQRHNRFLGRHNRTHYHVGSCLSGCTPIPAKIVDSRGEVIIEDHDIEAGQWVFLKYGLMQNGSIWGHGSYLDPDFPAAYLHE